MEEQHRSVSQLLKYSNCSEQYRLERVDRVNNFKPAAWLAQGTAFHHAVQVWEESGRSPEVDIGQEYEVAYDREIQVFKSYEPETRNWLCSFKTTPENDILARRAAGVVQLQNYVDFAEDSGYFIKYLDEYTLGIEVPFDTHIGKVRVKGAIDLLLEHPEGLEVRDLKTGNRESSPMQLAVYSLVVENLFKTPVIKASYFYAKDKKLVTLTRSDLDRYDEKYLSDLFEALDSGIKNQVFIPNPGSHCTMCPVKKYCREKGDTPKPFERKTL